MFWHRLPEELKLYILELAIMPEKLKFTWSTGEEEEDLEQKLAIAVNTTSRLARISSMTPLVMRILNNTFLHKLERAKQEFENSQLAAPWRRIPTRRQLFSHWYRPQLNHPKIIADKMYSYNIDDPRRDPLRAQIQQHKKYTELERAILGIRNNLDQVNRARQIDDEVAAMFKDNKYLRSGRIVGEDVLGGARWKRVCRD